MRKSLLLAAISLAVSSAPAAHAHPTWHYAGGCDSAAVTDGASGSQTTWSGTGSVVVVATESATGVPAPVSVSVDCVLYVDGLAVGTVASGSGVGAVAVTGPIDYYADPDAEVTLCELVTIAGEDHGDCHGVTRTTTAPPAPLTDALGEVRALACARLDPVAGVGVPGVVEVSPDRDVYVDGDLWWDCPPYDEGGAANPVPVDPGAEVDDRGYYARVGDLESASIDDTDLMPQPERANAGWHNRTSRCRFDRAKKQIVLSGQMTLGGHSGHSWARIRCELFNSDGVLIGWFDTTSPGGNAGYQLNVTSGSKRHTVCLTADGEWQDGHTVHRWDCRHYR